MVANASTMPDSRSPKDSSRSGPSQASAAASSVPLAANATYSTNWAMAAMRPAIMSPMNALAMFGILSVLTVTPRLCWISPPPLRMAARIEASKKLIPLNRKPSPRNWSPWVHASAVVEPVAFQLRLTTNPATSAIAPMASIGPHSF